MSRSLILLCAAALSVAFGLATPRGARGYSPPNCSPGDPLWSDEWGLSQIGLSKGWCVTRGSSGAVIADVDTGAQPVADLSGSLVTGYNAYNAIYGGSTTDTTDSNGHGTMVASIIAAQANNGIGLSGVCPGCKVMAIKASTGTSATIDLTAAANGVTWAQNHGAKVIILPFASGTDDSTLSTAIHSAEAAGVLVIASAGNTGASAPQYPSQDAGVMSVAGTDKNDEVYWTTPPPADTSGLGGASSWASTYGNGSNGSGSVTMAAPGCNPAATQTGGYRYQGSGGDFCGTSTSAPIVAGLAGLAFSYQPTDTAATVVSAIKSSTVDVQGSRMIAGHIVDAVAMFEYLGVAPCFFTGQCQRPQG